MGEPAGRRRCGVGGASIALTVALVLGGGTAALAATPAPTSSPTASATASPRPTATAAAKKPAIVYPTKAELQAAQHSVLAKAAEMTRIGELVITLQHQADAAGKASQVADERLLKAANAAQDAAAARQAADIEAATAAATAKASRTRASALAAHLARTDLGTLPLSLVLNSRISGGTLQGLSTATQLGSITARAYRQAETDEQTARSAKAAAAQAALSLIHI